VMRHWVIVIIPFFKKNNIPAWVGVVDTEGARAIR